MAGYNLAKGINLKDFNFDDQYLQYSSEAAAAKSKIEREIINEVSAHITTSQSPINLRIWSEEEKIPDKDILDKYNHIYSVLIKNVKLPKVKKHVITGQIFKNFDAFGMPDLNQAQMARLMNWSKEAFNIMNKYLKYENGYELTTARFEFLKIDENYFEIPNIPLINTRLLTSDGKAISTLEVLENYIASYKISEEDLKFVNEARNSTTAK